MYCPKCGQEQVAEGARFCSRCGLSLVEVEGLLERGGAPEAPRQEGAPPSRGLRTVKLFLLAPLLLLLLAILAGISDLDAAPEIFGMLAVLAFLIGTVRLLYLVAFKERRREREASRLAQQPGRVPAPLQHALSPSYVPPVGAPRARFDTAETMQPPSVVEQTTRRLEQEREREH